MSPQSSPGAPTLSGFTVRVALAILGTALAFTLLPTGAGATRRVAGHRAPPSASAARKLSGRAGRCARGALRLHSSYRQYRLCLRDGRLRGRQTTKRVTAPAQPPPTSVTPPCCKPPPSPAPPTAPPVAATKLTAAVYGDAPYGTSPSDTSQFQATPAFIDAVNADPKVQLVMQVGDIHSGKQYCTAAYDQSIVDLWARFADPLVYTPGDNEWADCHKTGEGGGAYNATTQRIDYSTDAGGNPIDYANGDPVANLDLVRLKFFPRAGSTLGASPMNVLSQAQAADPAHPTDREYVENVMWERTGVLFVTVDVPGGSNNGTDPWYGAPSQGTAQQREVANRTGADLRWLSTAFAKAKADGMSAMVVDWQADVWDLDGKPAAHLAQYDQFVNAAADGATAFGRPVLMLNGDSHEYKSDNPLAASDPANALHPGHDVANFHRVVVHGSTAPLEYLRLGIDTAQDNPTSATSFGPFSWERVVP